VRNGDPKADARAAASFTLLDGFQNFSIVATRALGEMASELSDYTRLVPGRHRHDDLIRAEDLGQEHGVISAGIRPNLNRVNKACNPFVHLSLAAMARLALGALRRYF
jgi:hypothetical protein